MLLVHTSCATKKEAEKIAAALVRAKLAACASVYACKSFFLWKEKFERQSEFVVEIKMKDSNYPKAERMIKKIHSYAVPQIIAVKIAKANRAYARWAEG
ncbi:MAG: divalent-cation tolerance protein CutA [Candidatus Anstonellaceae archaeon]